MEALRNKWAAGVIAFSIVTVLVYVFLPLFKIPIFEISGGLEWIRMVWMTKDFASIVSFLLPFIGAAGAIAVVFARKREPHILAVASRGNHRQRHVDRVAFVVAGVGCRRHACGNGFQEK